MDEQVNLAVLIPEIDAALAVIGETHTNVSTETLMTLIQKMLSAAYIRGRYDQQKRTNLEQSAAVVDEDSVIL